MTQNAGRWDAQNARRKERRRQDPDYRARVNAACRAYYQAHKQEVGKQVRTAQLKRRYGISPAEYDALLAKQGGACAICRRRAKGRLCVDHCHVTGMVRGLLCNECNGALGYLRDDQASLVAALAYLGALPRDEPGSAADRALAVHDVLPPWPTRRAVLTYPVIRCDAAPRARGKPTSPMRDALDAELARASDDGEGNKAGVLQLIARKLTTKALDGDLGAIREIFDRIDGKAVAGAPPEQVPEKVEMQRKE